jgi:hypothetical protein
MSTHSDIDHALSLPCIIDTSTLSNFVLTGFGELPVRLTGRPLLVAPVVIDENEVAQAVWQQQLPQSEFLAALFVAQRKRGSAYAASAMHVNVFVTATGHTWEPVQITTSELSVAAEISSGTIWKKCPPPLDTRTRGLGAGESESAAIALSRGFTLLCDDKKAVELVAALRQPTCALGTLELLSACLERSLLTCQQAADLFNTEMERRANFIITRKHPRKQRLTLECGKNAPNWIWVDA